jgi:hypothetical protein
MAAERDAVLGNAAPKAGLLGSAVPSLRPGWRAGELAA